VSIDKNIVRVMLTLNRPGDDPPQKPKPIRFLTVAEPSSPCESLSGETHGKVPMSDVSAIAQMTPAQIVEQSRKHLSDSYYTEVGSLPSVAIYDKAMDCFLHKFVDPDGCRLAGPHIPGAAFYGHHLGVWSRSYTEAIQAGDIDLAARCAAAASYFLTCLILGSRYCWRGLDECEE